LWHVLVIYTERSRKQFGFAFTLGVVFLALLGAPRVANSQQPPSTQPATPQAKKTEKPVPYTSAILIEAETGKGADALDRRPQLAAALAAARTAKCAVLISKLDRLSRDTVLSA